MFAYIYCILQKHKSPTKNLTKVIIVYEIRCANYCSRASYIVNFCKFLIETT